jgi:hypothetical protein
VELCNPESLEDPDKLAKRKNNQEEFLKTLVAYNATTHWNREELEFLEGVDWHSAMLRRREEISDSAFRQAGDLILSYKPLGAEVDFDRGHCQRTPPWQGPSALTLETPSLKDQIHIH